MGRKRRRPIVPAVKASSSIAVESSPCTPIPRLSDLNLPPPGSLGLKRLLHRLSVHAKDDIEVLSEKFSS